MTNKTDRTDKTNKINKTIDQKAERKLTLDPEAVKSLLRKIITTDTLGHAHAIATSALEGMIYRERGESRPERVEYTTRTCTVCGFGWTMCHCDHSNLVDTKFLGV